MTDSKKTGPKDVFGQLLAIIGLYVSVIAFGALIFGLININFPDVLSYDYGDYAKQSLKWPLAILVIVFPLFIGWNSYLQKDLEQNPEKKELKSRKWFLYFTLFAAAIVIIGDLVALVFRFLSGDLTIQFILKVFTVFLIAAAVFTYYLWNIRKSVPAARHPKMKGAFSIVFGFFSTGSPFAERTKRFDQRRIQDLQAIQYEIINYWQAKERLPETIDQLRDDIRGFIPPRDPETGEPYGYRMAGVLEFQLCADFKASNRESQLPDGPKAIPLTREVIYPAVPYNESWLHDAGEACFSRTIDPELFPPLRGKK